MPITKQTIAIIGADSNIGSSIAKSISGDNYRLLLFSDEVSSVQPLAEEITQSDSSADVDVRDCQHDACWEADIIILTVPYRAQKEVVERIKDVATQKIVISMPASISETGDPATVSWKIGATGELQERLSNSKIIKIFNTDFTCPVIEGKRADAFIAGNDEEALETVSELVKTAGFNPVVAGDLSVKPEMQKH